MPKNRAAGTINSYLSAVRCFVQYLVDTDILFINPIRSIRHLNTELDRRKLRRAMTKEEIERLLTAAANGIIKKVRCPEERVLIYKLLIGTGLRSTELSLLTPRQIDFEKCRLRCPEIGGLATLVVPIHVLTALPLRSKLTFVIVPSGEVVLF